jgi:hypothetical protein
MNRFMDSLRIVLEDAQIIESTAAVVMERDLKPDDIKEIRALLLEAAIQTVCEPQSVKRI